MDDLSNLMRREPIASAAGTEGGAAYGGALDALSALLGAAPPAPRSASLHYIRGVKNDAIFGGEDRDEVIYAPEFLYVFDFGHPARCGLSCAWRNATLGDPAFPDFTGAALRAVYGESEADLIYPCVAGELIVRAQDGADPAAVVDALRPYGTDASPSSKDTYLVKVEAFHEREVAARIQAEVPLVRYAEPNAIVRLIDFSPGWRISRVF